MLSGEGEQRAKAMQEAQRFMRDFSRIRVGEAAETLFTPAASVALFNINAAWLERRLAEPHAGATVVITHHAPSKTSIHPRFADSLLNACFVSDAERLVDGRRACLWIHGHTHDSFDYFVNGTRILCNPRGYAKDARRESAVRSESPGRDRLALSRHARMRCIGRRRADPIASCSRSRTTSDFEILRSRDSASMSVTSGSGKRTVSVFIGSM